MSQLQKIRNILEKSKALHNYARELNRWETADFSDIEHLDTLLNEAFEAYGELADTIEDEGEDE